MNYVTFIDFRRAFDAVNRTTLVKALEEKQFNKSLVGSIKSFLSDTSGVVNGREIDTHIGVPQGAVLSPTLFNLYLDPLLDELQKQGIRCLAYADDLTFLTRGTTGLCRAVKIVEDWSRSHGVNINTSKSAILPIRVDKRTPLSPYSKIKRIPVQDRYRYLGIEVDSSAAITPQARVLQTKLTSLGRKLSFQWANKLPKLSRWITWHAFTTSRFMYGLTTLYDHYPALITHLKRFLYHSIRKLLQINTMP